MNQMEDKRIPKIIHYCWFGRKEKPQKVQECIESWYKHLSEYKIIEWNEENFDVNFNEYTKQAYQEKKYAFVSDVARIEALYRYGGIYLDTDIEVIKPFDDLLSKGCILGFEEKNYIATSFMACYPKHPMAKEFCNQYKDLSFYNKDGSINKGTNVEKLTTLLSAKRFRMDGTYQEQEGITLYPQEYFSPYDYINCVYNITDKSYCIHHFYVSWLPWHVKAKKVVKKSIGYVIGRNNMNRIRAVLKR